MARFPFTERLGRGLFLDRDGVINTRLVDAYVKTPADFDFIEGVPQAIASLNKHFSPVVVVTNQQGVGKGIMTLNDLHAVHDKMISQLNEQGAHIDKVYFCPALEKDNHFDRKPSVGMGLKAKKDFTEIHFKNSVMVGDTFTDMEFGKRLGMTTVLIAPNVHLPRVYPHLIDFCFDSLLNFSKWVNNQLS